MQHSRVLLWKNNLELSPCSFSFFSLQVEKSLQRIQGGQCNPMYTSQQSVENKVWVELCFCFESQRLYSHTVCCMSICSALVRSVVFPGGKPSFLRWVSGWTLPVAVQNSRRFSSPHQTLGIGYSSAAPPYSPCLVQQLVYYLWIRISIICCPRDSVLLVSFEITLWCVYIFPPV